MGDATRVDRGNAANPSQMVTLYQFDGLGRRTATIEASSAIFGAPPAGTANARDLTTSYTYDSAGRVCCTIHPDGSRTWYTYDAAGQQIQTINALGEVQENTYDLNGRVTATRDYFNRLSASQLAGLVDTVSTPIAPPVDPQDQRSYAVYDQDGQVRFVLTTDNGTAWDIKELRHDDNGNVTYKISYDKSIDVARLNALDTSSSPGISVDEMTGELAVLGYDGTDATLGNTLRTRYAYDLNNQLRFTVDALGGVSEKRYDNAGNVVTGVIYAMRPSLSSYSESAISDAVNRNDPNNLVTQYAYDDAGRLRYTVRVLSTDRQVVSEQVYDGQNHVVQTIEYATALNAPADYKEATLAGLLTPMRRTSARPLCMTWGHRAMSRRSCRWMAPTTPRPTWSTKPMTPWGM